VKGQRWVKMVQSGWSHHSSEVLVIDQEESVLSRFLIQDVGRGPKMSKRSGKAR